MADATRLFAEFKDDLGNDYRINIHENGWGFAAVEFNLGADGFTLRYSGDNENRFQPVIGSEVVFTLNETLAQHTSFIDALATSEDADFTVSIYKDPDGANTLFWTGVLLSEQTELHDEYFPVENTLTAVDDLGNLTNIKYNNSGTAYTGRETVVEHLMNCLLNNRALHVYGATDILLRYANDFIPTTTFVSANALIESEINHSAFYNADDEGVPEFFDVFTVLENLAVTFNARLFYADGYYNFIPIGALIDDVTLNLFTVTKAGTVSATTTAVNTQLIVDTDIVRLAGGSTTYLPPLNKVQRTWVTNANLPVLFQNAQFLNPTSTQTDLGTTISDADLTYESNTELRLQFRYSHSYPGDGSSTGTAVPGRLVLRVQVKCGSLYYTNAVTFGPDTYSTGSYEFAYQMDEMTFSAPAWGAGAGYFYMAVTPTPVYIDRSTGAIINGGIYDGDFGAYVIGLGPTGPISIDLDALTSQQTGLDISFDVFGYDYAGNLITDITGATAYGKLNQAGAAVVNGNATNGDQVIYEANTTSPGQLNYESPDVQIGSAAFDDFRNIYDNNSTPGEVINQWGSLAQPTADLPIHQLGVKEILQGQNLSTRVKRGSIYKAFVSPFNTMKFGIRNFVPFETSFTARSVECEFEAFHITSDSTGVVVPSPEIVDVHPPVDDSEPVYNLRNNFVPNSGDIGPNVLQRFLQQPIYSNRNSSGSSYNIQDTDAVVFNFWGGADGHSSIYLPLVANSEGRTIRFMSDSTIAATRWIRLFPNATDTLSSIDGAASFDFDRSYDGITILCHDGLWYIVQLKEK